MYIDLEVKPWIIWGDLERAGEGKFLLPLIKRLIFKHSPVDGQSTLLSIFILCLSFVNMELLPCDDHGNRHWPLPWFTRFTSWGSETKLWVLLFSVLWALSSSLCVIIMGTDINLCFGGASNTVYPALYINRCSLQFVSLAVGEEGFCVWVTVVQMYHRLVLLVNAPWDSMADSLMEKSVRHALYIHHCYMGRRTCLLLS